MTDLEREDRRLRGELARAREDIADLQARLAYALQQIRELSTRIPRPLQRRYHQFSIGLPAPHFLPSHDIYHWWPL